MPSDTDIAYLLQQLLNAAPVAALYGLLAFGYGLTFGLTRRADFTPGALFAFSGQLFVFLTAFGWERLWLVYPAALSLGAAAAFGYTLLAALFISRSVTRPVAAQSSNSLVVVSLGIMIVLMELVRIAANSRDIWLSPVLNGRVTFWALAQFPVVLTQIQILNTVLMALVVGVGSLALSRAAFGRQWRAVADDRRAAALMGVHVDRVMGASTLLTAAVSAAAGILATAYYGSMDFGSGLMFGLKVVMIAAIGDQTSPSRAALGAAAYGVIETLWGAYMPYVWRDIALFSMLVALAVVFRRETRI